MQYEVICLQVAYKINNSFCSSFSTSSIISEFFHLPYVIRVLPPTLQYPKSSTSSTITEFLLVLLYNTRVLPPALPNSYSSWPRERYLVYATGMFCVRCKHTGQSCDVLAIYDYLSVIYSPSFQPQRDAQQTMEGRVKTTEGIRSQPYKTVVYCMINESVCDERYSWICFSKFMPISSHIQSQIYWN